MPVLPITEILFFKKYKANIKWHFNVDTPQIFVFPPVNLINQNSCLKIVTFYGQSLLKQTYVNRVMEDILLTLKYISVCILFSY
jgi:hypothetical protein